MDKMDFGRRLATVDGVFGAAPGTTQILWHPPVEVELRQLILAGKSAAGNLVERNQAAGNGKTFAGVFHRHIIERELGKRGRGIARVRDGWKKGRLIRMAGEMKKDFTETQEMALR